MGILSLFDLTRMTTKSFQFLIIWAILSLSTTTSSGRELIFKSQNGEYSLSCDRHRDSTYVLMDRQNTVLWQKRLPLPGCISPTVSNVGTVAIPTCDGVVFVDLSETVLQFPDKNDTLKLNFRGLYHGDCTCASTVHQFNEEGHEYYLTGRIANGKETFLFSIETKTGMLNWYSPLGYEGSETEPGIIISSEDRIVVSDFHSAGKYFQNKCLLISADSGKIISQYDADLKRSCVYPIWHDGKLLVYDEITLNAYSPNDGKLEEILPLTTVLNWLSYRDTDKTKAALCIIFARMSEFNPSEISKRRQQFEALRNSENYGLRSLSQAILKKLDQPSRQD